MNVIKEIFNDIQDAVLSAIKSPTPTGVQYRAEIGKYVTTQSDVTNTKVNEPINEKGGEGK